MGHKHKGCCYEYEYKEKCKCAPSCCNNCCNYGSGNLFGTSNNLILPLIVLALFCNRH
ncbi:hypothetical protein [Clostridium lundense]|uniref:hypothetical protein n=1 Tax=Clostridium lundense TaxID=319475 RepID=UPI000AAEBF51|nr:hypothetical protein [Clostridium lundense]